MTMFTLRGLASAFLTLDVLALVLTARAYFRKGS